MQDPSELYQFETDTDQSARCGLGVLVVALGGFIDAGHTQRLLADHLLETHDLDASSPPSTSTSCSTTAAAARS